MLTRKTSAYIALTLLFLTTPDRTSAMTSSKSVNPLCSKGGVVVPQKPNLQAVKTTAPEELCRFIHTSSDDMVFAIRHFQQIKNLKNGVAFLRTKMEEGPLKGMTFDSEYITFEAHEMGGNPTFGVRLFSDEPDMMMYLILINSGTNTFLFHAEGKRSEDKWMFATIDELADVIILPATTAAVADARPPEKKTRAESKRKTCTVEGGKRPIRFSFLLAKGYHLAEHKQACLISSQAEPLQSDVVITMMAMHRDEAGPEQLLNNRPNGAWLWLRKVLGLKGVKPTQTTYVKEGKKAHAFEVRAKPLGFDEVRDVLITRLVMGEHNLVVIVHSSVGSKKQGKELALWHLHNLQAQLVMN